MNINFCAGKFWNLNQTWNTQMPQFSPCFEDVVFTICPSVFFSFILFCKLFHQPRHNPLPWRWLNTLKLVFSLFLLIISTVLFGITIYKSSSLENNVPLSSLLAHSARVILFLLIFLTVLKHRSHGVITSTILSHTWIVFTCCGIVLYRSAILKMYYFKHHAPVNVVFWLNMMYYPIIFCQLFLSIFTDERKISPLRDKRVMDDLSFLANVTFLWFSKMISLAKKKMLTVQDLSFWNVCVTTQYSYTCFAKHWQHYLGQDQSSKPSLGWALAKAFAPWFLITFSTDLVSLFTALLSPLLLDRIIDFTHDDLYTWRGYFYAVIIFITDLLSKNLYNNSVHYMSITTVQLQEALMSAVFRKNLYLASEERKRYDSGSLMNLISVDVKRLQWLAIPAIALITAPIKICIVLYIMWQYLGIATLSGVGIMFLSIPVTYLLSRQSSKFSEKQMTIKDLRQKYMNEILLGIKILKLYAWEKPFSAKVFAARKDELKCVFYNLMCYVGSTMIYFCAPFLISLVTFATYLFLDNTHVLDATKAFVSLSLMDQLRYALLEIPDSISDFVQFQVSLGRLRKYFRAKNTESCAIGNSADKGDAITLRNASFSWTSDGNLIINNVSLHVPKGKLVAVIGQVGAGKSSLISAIIGEMCKKAGSIDIEGSVAYVSQTPWILNRSLKENILLVRRMDEERYNVVLDSCCLRPDLEILPGRDMTEIGEKGVNLSGGQKLRVSLAQAVYQDKDIYFFDDPLSAVDVHVGKALFKDVIGNEGILRTKTRVLVTHSVSVLPDVDLIVCMKDGSIDEIGTYSELIESNGAFKKFVEEHASAKNVEEEPPENKTLDRFKLIGSTSGGGDADYYVQKKLSINDDESDDKIPGHRLTQDEAMEVGGVDRFVYLKYIKRLGIPLFVISAFWYMAYAGFMAASNIWIKDWTADTAHKGSSYVYWRLEIYSAFGLAQLFAVFLASSFLIMGSNRASLSYHTDMLNSVLKSPMQFFDSTPAGRIVNRFTIDIDTVDIQLFYRMDGWLNCFFSTIFTFIVIGMNVPLFLSALAPLGFLYYNIQRLHLNTLRQIRRLESVNRSPIFSLYLESIHGASQISAYGIKEEFIERFEEKLDACFLCLFNSYICNRWLNFWLELCGSLVVLVVTLLVISDRHSLTPAAVGLVVSYALSVTDNLKWLVRMNSELEDKSISIERIEEYCTLEPEANWDSPPDSLDPTWPQNGNIMFENYSTRYRENLDLVLKKINLAINEHEKVGIIGRTGAGKSSITLALFRILEPAAGTIFIDSVDVTRIGLHDLRRNLTIIPQDPVLFNGSLRMNLDPNNEYSDEALWQSLDKAHLKMFVSGLESGLYYQLDENGSNLSAGQKQLVCLARALLKNTKILIMDEATASVDMETDSLIQKTIRTAFSENTVITIAHRLHTISDFDKIVVMDNGCVVEVGSPTSLLQDTNSMFYHMNKEAGLV